MMCIVSLMTEEKERKDFLTNSTSKHLGDYNENNAIDSLWRMKKANHLSIWWILLVVVFSVIPRLYHAVEMPYDRHNFRQSATYAVILNFFEHPNIFRPRYYYRSIPENIERYAPVEFPLFEYLGFLVMKLFGEWISVIRILNIVIASLGALLIARIGELLFSSRVGIIAGVLFSLFPVSLFYGRSVMPDMFALTAFLTAIWSIVSRTKFQHFIFLISMGIALVTKPYYLAFIPLIIVLVHGIKRGGNSESHSSQLFYYTAGPMFITALWYFWMKTFPSVAQPENSTARLMHGDMGYIQFWAKTHWPWQYIVDFVPNTILSPLGAWTTYLGLLLVWWRFRRVSRLLFIWLLCVMVVVFTFSWGSMNHDYYSLQIAPIASLLGAITLDYIWILLKSRSLWVRRIVLLVTVVVIASSIKSYSEIISSYYSVQTDLHNPRYYEEARKIRENIGPNQVIGIFKQWNPYLLNMMKIPGIVYGINQDKPCPAPSEVQSQIDYFVSLYAPYVMVQKEQIEEDVCKRSEIESVVHDLCGTAVIKGEVLSLYRCNKQSTAR